MATRELARPMTMPTVFEDFFKPFNELFDINGGSMWNRVSTTPHVNIVDGPAEYIINMAVPGFKKDDFKIDLNKNMLTIWTEKEEKTEEKEIDFTRREFNYYTFTRSFTLPEDVLFEKIVAKYEDGILMLTLPKKEEAKKMLAKKHIPVI